MKREDLTAFVDGQLSDEERARAEREIDGDPELLDELSHMFRQRLLLAEVLRDESRRAAFGWLAPFLKYGAAPAAAAVLLFVVGASLLGGYRFRRELSVTVTDVVGDASPLAVGDVVGPGEGVTCGDDVELGFAYRDGTRMRLSGGARLDIAHVHGAKRIVMRCGAIALDVAPQGEGRPLSVVTPRTVVEVRGTSFTVAVGPDVDLVDVVEGAVLVSNTDTGEAIDLTGGEMVAAAAGRSLSPQKGDPEMKERLVSLVLSGAFLAATGWGADNVLPNGTFDEKRADGLPAVWRIGGHSVKKLELIKEGERTYLRITHTERGGTAITQALQLKPEWRKLRIETRMRARKLDVGPKSYTNARVQLTWRDAKGERVGDWPHSPNLTRDSEWTEISTNEHIPVGATQLNFEVALWESIGVFDIEYVKVRVTALGDRGAVDLPEGVRLHWGEEPVVALSEARSEIVLNGVWKFVPARGPAEVDPTAGWGYIRVPGVWNNAWNKVGVIVQGSGAPWQNLNRNDLAKAWYERSFKVPAEWSSRAVLVDLQRVSTDAAVYVNGTKCGEVHWPTGRVDVTKAVTFGGRNKLRILAAAVGDEGEVMVIMGPNQISTRKASLSTRGITGDVTLVSRPKGAHVSDVFVQTSTRKSQLALDVELADVARDGDATFTASIRNARGVEEERFTETRPLRAAATQTVRMSWNWWDPRLWDYKQPNVYTLHLKVEGAGVDDVYPQRFGFREFWVAGRKFFLNGSEFRLRPIQNMGYHANNETVAEAMIRGRMAAGFNIQEFWPNNHAQRGGDYHARELWARVADRTGWPLIGCAMYMSNLAGDPWKNPGVKRRWRERMEAEIRRYRNHPSILMWVHSGNRFGHRDDQNPWRIGQRSWDDFPEDWRERARQCNEACDLIKKADPTRPVMSHQNGPTSDVYALNSYLCMMPLQEREEWLSHWAETGDMPYMVVEGGTPLDSTLSRNRHGGHRAGIDEPLPTEFCSIYLGEKAFERETPGLRANIEAFEEHILSKERAGAPQKPAWHMNHRAMRKNGEVVWAFQDIQDLFIRNTWRSWRTWGLTGGMVPWGLDRIGYQSIGEKPEWANDWSRQEVAQPPFKPGTRGMYYPRLRKSMVHHMRPQGYAQVLRAAKALAAVNSDTLAWIAGSQKAWVEKDHHFYVRDRIEKQVVVINDARTPQSYRWTLEVSLDGRRIERFAGRGRLEVAENKFEPVAFTAPRVREKTSGVMKLTATVGELSHEHEFAFRVYPRERERDLPTVLVFDPEGETSKVLREQGIALEEWDGAEAPGRVLVVGRRALSGDRALPGDLDAFVNSGGRAIVHAQDPTWMREKLGLRVSAFAGRWAFPLATQASHPIVAGLDGEDFRDWRGRSTLVKERCVKRDITRHELSYSYGDGWHWGNRGSVSSCIVEKPHHTGWTPILEGEFDLAFSSLMELHYGRGLVLLNTLDVEGRGGIEPVADIVTRRCVAYAAGAPVAPRARRTIYAGGPKGEAMVAAMGLRYERTSGALPADAQLVVLGEEPPLGARTIERFVRGGGSVVYLSPWPRTLPFGLAAEVARGRYAKLPETDAARGLSVGEVHTRYDVDGRRAAGRGVTHLGDGLLSLYDAGRGKVWFVGVRPEVLGEDEHEYLRYSRWRLTRGLSQVLANCGGEFAGDGKLFVTSDSKMAPVALAGEWTMAVERKLAPAAGAASAHRDAENRGERDGWQRIAPRGGDWQRVTLPGPWEDASGSTFDGGVWFRRTVKIPSSWRGQDLTIELGPIDDFDITFFNGERVGSTDVSVPNFWSFHRKYAIPGRLVDGTAVTIAVRVWDHFGGGGMYAESRDHLKLYRTSRPGDSVVIGGAWKYRIEKRLTPAPNLQTVHPDPGVAPFARGWGARALDERDWDVMTLPQPFEKGIAAFDGAVWYRREIDVPASYDGKDLMLELGPIDDFDVTYFNGERVGATGGGTPNARGVARRYRVPARLVKAGGKNVIAVRVFDAYGNGGLVGEAKQLRLLVDGVSESATWYVPGYRTDHARGDSYTRYYRW